MSLAAMGRSDRRRLRRKRRLLLTGAVAALVAMVAVLLAVMVLSQSVPPQQVRVGDVSFMLPGDWTESSPGVFSDRTALSSIKIEIIDVAPDPDLAGMLGATWPQLEDEAEPVDYPLGAGVRLRAINGSLLAVAISFEVDQAPQALVVSVSGDLAVGGAVLDRLLSSATLIETIAK